MLMKDVLCEESVFFGHLPGELDTKPNSQVTSPVSQYNLLLATDPSWGDRDNWLRKGRLKETEFGFST